MQAGINLAHSGECLKTNIHAIGLTFLLHSTSEPGERIAQARYLLKQEVFVVGRSSGQPWVGRVHTKLASVDASQMLQLITQGVSGGGNSTNIEPSFSLF